MPERAADIVERMWRAMAAGDAAAGFGMFGPGVEWHGTVGGLTEGERLQGQGPVLGGFLDLLEDWASFVVELDGIVDVSEEKAIGLFREVATGRASGLATTTDSAIIFAVADGAIVSIRAFLDVERALAAVGLDGSAEPRPGVPGVVDFGALAKQVAAGP